MGVDWCKHSLLTITKNRPESDRYHIDPGREQTGSVCNSLIISGKAGTNSASLKKAETGYSPYVARVLAFFE